MVEDKIIQQMYTEHSTAGLEKHEILVDDEGEIRLVDYGGTIKIGELQTLYELEPYKDGTFTTENGVVIHLESYIDAMAITDTMAENIKCSRTTKEDSDDLLTPRMHRFHGILYNRLRGNIKKQ